MRLRRLLLHNYRRYRDAEVEFPDGVFALLGRNGSGKSTLLEAVSFALFGPAAIRTDKTLLRSAGAAPGDAVHVELDLELGGQAVRIQRELRGKAQTPSASLEIDGVAIVPPGAGSSEAATREIERRLGMDRDAFHTTVVAQQGELSRLADAKPADRKRLLLRMLGIDRVERAIEEARSRRNVAAGTLERLRGLLPDVPGLRTQVAAFSGAAQTAEATTANLETQAAAATHSAKEATTIAANEEKAAEAARAEAFQLAALRAEEGHRAQAAARLRPELAQAEAAANRAGELAPLAGDVERREEDLRNATLVEAARGQHIERMRYVMQQRQVVTRLQTELAALVVPAPDPVLAQAGEGLVLLETTLRERSTELAVLESRLAEVEERRRKIERLGPGAPCPTCERPLNGELHRMHEEVSGSFQGLMDRTRATQAEIGRLRIEATGVRVQLEAANRQATQAQHVALRRGELERRAMEEARRLADLEGMMGPEPPAGPDLPRLRAACLEARRAREEQARLLGLAGRQPALAVQVADAAASHAAAVAARQALEATHRPPDEGRLLEARRRRDAAVAQLHAAERQLHAARLAAQQARSDHAAAARRLQEAEAMARQVTGLEQELRLWNSVVGRAGGGLLDRFRDHLVGRVGPAISAEASRLLSGFSGGRYTEVLLDDEYQVFVTDQGVPYALERFSGGEADLVHLALRLAVSRLLAERGGVELRFLALDEVFGSLDRERRELVVGTLQSLGTLYSQVLVVSHLEGLQETLGDALRVVEDGDGQAAIAAE